MLELSKQHKEIAMPATIDGLRTGEAARLIGVSEQTVRGPVRAGKLKAVSTPLGALIDEDSAHQLAAAREQAARTRRGSDLRVLSGGRRPRPRRPGGGRRTTETEG